MSLRTAWFVSDVTTVLYSCGVAIVVIVLIKTAPADGANRRMEVTLKVKLLLSDAWKTKTIIIIINIED